MRGAMPLWARCAIIAVLTKWLSARTLVQAVSDVEGVEQQAARCLFNRESQVRLQVACTQR